MTDPEILEAKEMLYEHIRARAELPGLLACAIRLGHSRRAIEAILDWGEGKKPVVVVWQEISAFLKNSNPNGKAGRVQLACRNLLPNQHR